MKKILFVFVILLWGCTKPDLPIPEVLEKEEIFDVSESGVSNGQNIKFTLPADGAYTLTLINKETGQVVSREKFNGQKNENIKKIYTNSLPKGYLYLVLEDINKTELKKTVIIIN